MAKSKIEKKTALTDEGVVLDGGVGEACGTGDETLDDKSRIADALSNINEAIDEITGSEPTVSKVRAKKVSYKLTDMIPCKSLFLGKMIYTSPTNGARYIWKDFGAVSYVPFGELQTMNNHKPDYLNDPLILINDTNVVDYFNLASVYEKVANINKLVALFNSANLSLIRTKIKESVTVGMREAVVAKVCKMREDGTLVDINIIKILKEELVFDFE